MGVGIHGIWVACPTPTRKGSIVTEHVLRIDDFVGLSVDNSLKYITAIIFNQSVFRLIWWTFITFTVASVVFENTNTIRY